MADAPEVYQAPPQGSPHAAHTGPYYGGPRPESEGLQVHSVYVENCNKAPYPDNPALGPQQPYQQPYQQQPYQQPPQQQGQYINSPPQMQYAENQPGGLLQAAPYATQPDEKGGKKRICGLSVVVFWCLIVAAVLIVAGAVVGGVVGSKKAKDSKGAGSSSSVLVSAGLTGTPTATTGLTSTDTTTTAMFDEGIFYRLSNQYLKAGYSLDIHNDNGTLSRKLNMMIRGDTSGQYWQIKKVPDADERYWFACQYLGKDIRLFLDPSDRISPLMATADDTATGQQWNIRSVLDGTWRISNALESAGAQLSTYSDTHDLFMDMEDDLGTEWSIAEAKKISAGDGFL
ncbi:hypothetical protein VC83_08630 [Pseudogymnoascus destructans]|uniref:Ricin B lectin domain-containing protein n=2 Tax=Pseudogymnoascus destructans TaxID=655981 RepID=L8FQS2_PSED2|nr:uncharacterized protein VC83_08630 [Pseudogymnoascus destructans]ELR03325.1 hypothetical protein GMDG_06072 [Pseudogymnoascus destructans 20631-21]OAF54873.1 hypothetical protein VC83_08630 [Pseudogymnoascus destructans]